jgi:putative flavoprotein involved in K+ transport
VIRGLFHRVVTLDTPIGRKARPTLIRRGGPLVRIRPGALEKAGVTRVPRVAGVRERRPVLEDGRVLDPVGIIWGTGFRNRYDWIDLPVHGDIEPRHDRGVVPDHPGLFFTGLHFQYSLSSEMIHAAERDAGAVAAAVAKTAASRDAGVERQRSVAARGG